MGNDAGLFRYQQLPRTAEEIITVIRQIRPKTLGNTPRTAGQSRVVQGMFPRHTFSSLSGESCAKNDVTRSD